MGCALSAGKKLDWLNRQAHVNALSCPRLHFSPGGIVGGCPGQQKELSSRMHSAESVFPDEWFCPEWHAINYFQNIVWHRLSNVFHISYEHSQGNSSSWQTTKPGCSLDKKEPIPWLCSRYCSECITLGECFMAMGVPLCCHPGQLDVTIVKLGDSQANHDKTNLMVNIDWGNWLERNFPCKFSYGASILCIGVCSTRGNSTTTSTNWSVVSSRPTWPFSANRGYSFLLPLDGFSWSHSCSGRTAGKQTTREAFEILCGQMVISFRLAWSYSLFTPPRPQHSNSSSLSSNEPRDFRSSSLLGRPCQYQP